MFSSAFQTSCTCWSHSYAAGTWARWLAIIVGEPVRQRLVDRSAELHGPLRDPELGAEPERARPGGGDALGQGVDGDDVGRRQLQHPGERRQDAPLAQPLAQQQRPSDPVAHLGRRLPGEGDQGDLVGAQVGGDEPSSALCALLVASRKTTRSAIVSVLPVPAPARTITSAPSGRVHDAVLGEVDVAAVVGRLDGALDLLRACPRAAGRPRSRRRTRLPPGRPPTPASGCP